MLARDIGRENSQSAELEVSVGSCIAATRMCSEQECLSSDLLNQFPRSQIWKVHAHITLVSSPGLRYAIASMDLRFVRGCVALCRRGRCEWPVLRQLGLQFTLNEILHNRVVHAGRVPFNI